MRIFLDAMGGDNAPQAPVAGALEALRRFPRLEIVLAGDPAAIEPLLKDGEDVRSRLTVLDAPEVITNHESPVMGVRRKTKSATVIGMLQLRDKEVDGFVSAGSIIMTITLAESAFRSSTRRVSRVMVAGSALSCLAIIALTSSNTMVRIPPYAGCVFRRRFMHEPEDYSFGRMPARLAEMRSTTWPSIIFTHWPIAQAMACPLLEPWALMTGPCTPSSGAPPTSV